MDLATFKNLTVPVSGHLIWTGRRTRDGYPMRGSTYVHRWTHEQFIGPIPDGYEVDHTCELKVLCLNPEHLEAVTKQENMRRAGERVQVCKNGHPYTPENTYRQPGTGRKSCKTCRRAARAEFIEKNPGYMADWYRRRKQEGA